LLTVGATQALKSLFGRPRPFAYARAEGPQQDLRRRPTARRSFPSGHTANAFAAATFLGTVFGRLQPGDAARTWVWAGGLGVAAAVGYLRIRSGWHFPTDVVAGALIGAAAGALVPKLHDVAAEDEGANLSGSFAVAWRVAL
jgi:undecaprenyl-diphosphatase